MSVIAAARPIRFTAVTAVAALCVGLLTAFVAPAAQAAPVNDIRLAVAAAPAQQITGAVPDPTRYRWLISREDTGDPRHDPTTTAGRANLAQCLPPSNNGVWPPAPDTIATYDPQAPQDCPWPSIRNTPGYVPVVAQGDQDTLDADTALADLPVGKYLISVLAPGYKLGGAHFQIPIDDTANTISVPLDADPTPLGNIRIQVFQDVAPVDGRYEAGAEPTAGMGGFQAFISDVLGAVTTDWFGNPLCTHYVHENANDLAHPVTDFPDGWGKVVYDANGDPVVDGSKPARCRANDVTGEIVIPNLGPNRYGVTVSTPNGQTWSQTTTLEGQLDHDVWVMEGDTGYDTELTVGGENVPFLPFGFISPKALPNAGGHTVTGKVMEALSYIGGQGGTTVPGEPGTAGMAIKGPIAKPWIALSDLSNGDQMVYAARSANTDGSFSIGNVPDGTYQLTMWDNLMQHLLFSVNVTVAGTDVDVKQQPLMGWFTKVEGYVYVDSNGNGKKDAGEAGIPGTTLTLRERDNTPMDQFTNLVTTGNDGHYVIDQAYPLTKWLILEHFNTKYEGTGVTVQAYNDPNPTTFLGAGVDINLLPVIGLGGRIDWGVKPYAPGTNGGIAGTVSYDTTRNELDPAVSAAEDYQPGVPDLQVHLYAPVPCDANDTPGSATCSVDGYQIEQTGARAGALARGPELADTYTTETWAPPNGCTARDWKGDPLNPPAQFALPAFGNQVDGVTPDPPTTDSLGQGQRCVEAPMTGFTSRPSDATPGNFGQTVNGNYGFADSNLNLYPPGDDNNPAPNKDLALYADLATNNYPLQPLPAADYLVGIDLSSVADYQGNPIYQVTREEDINVFTGDTHLPQENFPVPAADLTGQNVPGPQPVTTTPGDPPAQGLGFIPPCAGASHVVDVKGSYVDTNGNGVQDPGEFGDTPAAVENIDLAGNGGSPYEGQSKPLCTDKLVTLRDQQAVAPTFFVFTQVPLPTHFWGLVINDLGLTYDKRSNAYGEAQGIPNVPVGLYDWKGSLVDTLDTDYNGYYEALEPSTGTYNCPLPAGPCPGMYRFVGNDPGTLEHPNPNYNSRFRTIGTNFQAWPGLFTVTDTAPTQVASVVLTPGGTTPVQPNCDPANSDPKFFSVDRPNAPNSGNAANRRIVINGANFGADGGQAGVFLVDPNNAAAVSTPLPGTAMTNINWGTDQIRASVPGGFTPGPYTLMIRKSDGRLVRNAVTIHVTDTGPGAVYNPRIFVVDGTTAPGRYPTIQAALNVADTTAGRSQGTPLVVVYPNQATTLAFANPHRAYFENLLVHGRVKLQGVGAGGFRGATFVPGSEINGFGFSPDAATGTAWYDLLATFTDHAGIPEVADAATVTVVPPAAGDGAFSNTNARARSGIDGFSITGGVQQNTPLNGAINGNVTTPVGAPGARITQGGGVYVHAGANGLQIRNNVIAGNGGSYAGGIRVGTPYVDVDNANDNLRISGNVIRDNGGTNLAGGIGLFAGSDSSRVDHNVLCGNFSAEYGGAVTHYGLSAGPSYLTDNQIYYNTSYDEGGGLMVAGELPADPNGLSTGSGPVTIERNTIAMNDANDDGGGVRFLQVGNFPMVMQNNVIADNVSAHEGGGVALDDTPNLFFANNTVVKNITTATAVTSDGKPAPAGLSTADNSDQLMLTLPPGASLFSNPTLFNNIFWDNRAGTWDSATQTVKGITTRPATDPLAGTDPVANWDLGRGDHPGLDGNSLYPIRSLLQTTRGTVWPALTANPNLAANGYNRLATNANVGLVNPATIGVSIVPWRTNPAFRQAIVITPNRPLTNTFDYHLTFGSVANNLGRGQVQVQIGTSNNFQAPSVDLDGQTRYAGSPGNNTQIDAGADER